jgi:hypothetical protein
MAQRDQPMNAIHSDLTVPTTFEPAVLDEMSKAFVEACTELHVCAGDNFGRELVATRIIDLARRGVVDAKTLCDRVLLESGSATLARLP